MEMYDSGDVLSIVGSIGVLITALGAVVVNIIVALKTGKKVDANTVGLDRVSNQVEQVHQITNSNLQGVKAELAKSSAQIDSLKAIVNELKSERDKLATITALNTPGRPHSTRATDATDKGIDTLRSIDKNTENIDANTKKLISNDAVNFPKSPKSR